MSWFIVAIIPPLLWAIVNHTDKYLLSKVSHKSSVEVLMVYSTLFSFVLLPFILIFSFDTLFYNWFQVLIQILGGILLTISIYFYLKALFRDEASVVIPFALLVPVFGYFLSFFALGEILSLKQILSCLLIIIGSAILSLEFNEENKIRMRKGVVFFMVLCTFAQALQETLFKLVTINNSFAASIFWLHVGILICGFLLLFFRKGLKDEFIFSVKKNGRAMLGVNILSETISAVAYVIRDYSTLLAPIALVMTLNGYQPVFVFILGIILTIFLPNLSTEKIKPLHLVHKGLAISIILAGTLLISKTTI